MDDQARRDVLIHCGMEGVAPQLKRSGPDLRLRLRLRDTTGGIERIDPWGGGSQTTVHQHYLCDPPSIPATSCTVLYCTVLRSKGDGCMTLRLSTPLSLTPVFAIWNYGWNSRSHGLCQLSHSQTRSYAVVSRKPTCLKPPWSSAVLLP